MTQLGRNAVSLGLVMLFLVLFLSIPRFVLAAGEVTSVTTHTETSSPFRYTLGENTFTWGMSHNEILDTFVYQGNSYRYLSSADNVNIKRVDRAGVSTGSPCSIFAEQAANFQQLKPNFPAAGDGSGNCDIAAMLGGRIVNRGVLDVFMNVSINPGVTTSAAKNIERIDFVFNNGVVAPLQEDLLDRAGHLASEKRGNNSIQIAAILELDDTGEPASYGPLIRINPIDCADPDICYGVTPLSHSYSFFTSSAIAPQSFPEYLEASTESVALAFISLKVLGISAGQRYFGFSYFPKDIDPAVHVLTDPASFPADTVDADGPDDGADMYGGMSGYFIADDSFPGEGSVVTTSVFFDVDGDGARGDTEAGVEGVSVTLFEDSNGNSVYDPGTDTQIGTPQSTNNAGFVFASGVADGQYFVLLDENDPDIPSGLRLPPGNNPVLITTPLTAGTNVDFAFAGAANDDPGAALTANDDTEIVSQNIAQVLDVLENDTNPAAGEMTIVSVNGVNSGVVTIQDGALNYQPEVDFIGTTAFTYTIENSEGQRDTGNVSINVVQFSDINNNMQNDFVECNCTDLGLITGIHGSGVGALSGSLTVLGAVLWFRRRRPGDGGLVTAQTGRCQ